jgi:transcriptional repressor NrdR
MKCPCPKASDTKVVDSRESEDGKLIRRRRACLTCDKRFTTFEKFELRMPHIIKGSGIREEFEEDKLRVGFQRALHKRPVPTEYVDAAVDRIAQKLLSMSEREVDSRKVGELVMLELKKLDKVAYIRFASVYRDFQDVDDFRDAIKEVQRAPARKRRVP